MTSDTEENIRNALDAWILPTYYSETYQRGYADAMEAIKASITLILADASKEQSPLEVAARMAKDYRNCGRISAAMALEGLIAWMGNQEARDAAYRAAGNEGGEWPY